MIKLPHSVQEIADVIGRREALFLIGKLPRCFSGVQGHKSTRVIMYVPKTLKTNHPLVEILGYANAHKLVRAFGGEILQPGNCYDVYRRFRDQSILRMIADGEKASDVAQLMSVSERHVRNLLRAEKPQEERAVGNDNNR